MEAPLDFSQATDQELRDQLDRAKKHLAALVAENRPRWVRYGSALCQAAIVPRPFVQLYLFMWWAGRESSPRPSD
jgi:hypothetical protein